MKETHLPKHQVIDLWQWLQKPSPGNDETRGLGQGPSRQQLGLVGVLAETYIKISKTFGVDCWALDYWRGILFDGHGRS